MKPSLVKQTVTPVTHSGLMPGNTATQRHHLRRQLCPDPTEWHNPSALPERALLAAVVMQAYLDATQAPRSLKAAAIHREAWAFFAAPGQLEWFCELLDWEPARLREIVLSRKQ